jgi:hypothetical protein
LQAYPLLRFCYYAAGIFASAYRLGPPDGDQEKNARKCLLDDAGALRKTLKSMLASAYARAQNGSFVKRSIWFSEDDADAVTTAFTHKLVKAKKGLQKLLYEVVSIEVS